MISHTIDVLDFNTTHFIFVYEHTSTYPRNDHVYFKPLREFERTADISSPKHLLLIVIK